MADTSVRDYLLKLAHDLPFLANAKSKPASVVLAGAKAKLWASEEAYGQKDRSTFTRMADQELASEQFNLTCLINGDLVKASPLAGVAPKKPLKCNIAASQVIVMTCKLTKEAIKVLIERSDNLLQGLKDAASGNSTGYHLAHRDESE